MSHSKLYDSHEVVSKIKEHIASKERKKRRILDGEVAEELDITYRALRRVKDSYKYPNPIFINAVVMWCIDNNLVINKFLAKKNIKELYCYKKRTRKRNPTS